MTDSKSLPIAILGAGPVGLAAAAHLIERGLPFVIFEAGERVAASIADWGHVRLFTPWSYLIDSASRRLLTAGGQWRAPDDEVVPYGRELVAQYLEPLSRLAAFSPHIRLRHRVLSVSRAGHDRMMDGAREHAAFLVVADTPEGQRRYRASAVIDASGTWTTPNPLGAGGVGADGELENAASLRYGMPDVLERERSRYAGKRVLVVGSGHSAIGTVLGLRQLAERAPGTAIAWAVRRRDPTGLWGGGSSDQLAQRGALGTEVHDAVHSGAVALLTGFAIAALRRTPEGIVITDVDGTPRVVVDEVVVATGSRPDLGMVRELRLSLDLATESTRVLGPLIDPNHHSCGSVKPHGVEELRHPEVGFFTIGMKSYGRAPTFLLVTGYEQARSVVAELAGDHESARKVELILPETGVCSVNLSAGGAGAGACC